MTGNRKIIQYVSDNGYVGTYYAKSSLIVRDKNGEERFHTHRRSIDTYFELKEFVDTFPEFMEMLIGGFHGKL